jgi:hypothetical protein
MARRIFPNNDAWPSEACRTSNDVTVAFADILAILEEDGPIDLKDFHFIITEAVGTFVAGLSITRRLGDPATPPNPIIRAYPSLLSGDTDKDREPILLKNKFVHDATDVPQALALEKQVKDLQDWPGGV